MAIEIPDFEPTQFTAGDTVKWSRSLSDFSASDSWQLSYRVRGLTTYSIAWGVEVTASGANFNVVVPAATSATWAAGDYQLFGFVTKASERQQIYTGALAIIPNHVAVSNNYDPRTRIQRTLEAIEAMMEGTASREEQGYTITHGAVTQTLALFPRDQLIKLHSYYSRLRAEEIAAERANAGKGSGRRILTRFQ